MDLNFHKLNHNKRPSCPDTQGNTHHPTFQHLVPHPLKHLAFEGSLEYTDSLGEIDPIKDLSQHFEHLLHLEEQLQSSHLDHHQPLPPIIPPVNMSNISTETTTRPSKLHLRQPDDFNGSSNKASAWIDSVQLYLINAALYDTDQRRIVFTLPKDSPKPGPPLPPNMLRMCQR